MKIKTYLPAIIIVLSLVGLAGLWWVFNPPKAQVVSVFPKPGTTGVEFDVTGRVVFDREIEEDWVEVSISPETSFSTRLPLEKKSLILDLQELEPETVYTVFVFGPRVKELSWQFETKSSEPEIEEGGMGDPDFWKEEEKALKENPLLLVTPYLTHDFKIERVAQRVARVDLYAEDKESTKEAVSHWLQTKGIDPESIRIQWVE